MRTRWRIFLAAMVLVVLPAGILAGFLRARLVDSVRQDHHRRWRDEMLRELRVPADASVRIRERLHQLARAAGNDNRLRLALSGQRDDLLPYLRDHAGQMALTAGLDVLELVDADGQVLSSAHYRNEFGSDSGPLLRALQQLAGSPQPATLSGSAEMLVDQWRGQLPALTVGTAFTVERRTDDQLLVLLDCQDIVLGDRTYHWLGGQAAEASRVATTDTVLSPAFGQLALDDPDPLGRWAGSSDHAWLALGVPYIHAGRIVPALYVGDASRAYLRRQLQRIDVLVGTVFVAVMAGAFVLAAWLSGRLASPLVALSRQAQGIEVEGGGIDLATDRRDEVGQLARVLDEMVRRLRAGARDLAEAERRAAIGDVARQVNHDLRNGLTPVRHVLKHLGEIAEHAPGDLAAVFKDRRATLDGSLSYLEDLAGRYARVAPESRREACDLAAIAREVATAHGPLELTVAGGPPRVLADPVSLRRILENLVRNAREALPMGRGNITIAIAGRDDPELGPQCVLTVTDDGVGMPPEVRDRVLEDFFTTKPGGTGLGLSNVRRLAGDAGGQLEIASTPGAGTTVTIIFDAAEAVS